MRGFFSHFTTHPLAIPLCAVVTQEPAFDFAPADLVRLAVRTADEFILHPFRRQELTQTISILLGVKDAPKEKVAGAAELALLPLVGCSSSFNRVLEQMPFVARSKAPVMILGETGTGKEVCARAIHALSPRRNGPFVPFDCCSVPEHLFENELFGHCRGAYTDAHSDQRGLVAQAENGTLLLDEIDSLSPGAQAKLLRFLQEGTYRPLGSERQFPANVQVIAATNTNLELEVQQKRFRADLYFRLNVLRLELPALRDRPGDVGILAEHFLDTLCAAANREKLILSPGALRLLDNYTWPGNIRELYNVINRLVVLCPGPQVLPSQIPWATAQSRSDSCAPSFNQARAQVIENFEREYVTRLLRKNNGNVSSSAREAGKDRRTFGRLIKKYNIQRFELN
jgi:DNA-binding NtrC family response regulator